MKKYKYSIYVVLALWIGIHTAAIGQSLGLEFDEAGYNATPMPAYNYGSKSDDKVPFVAEVSRIPAISYQGSEGRCVGEATAYYAMTIMYANEEKWEGSKITQEAFSPRYVYNNVKLSDCRRGTTFPRALNFLANTGNLKNKDFKPINCYQKGNATHKSKARQYKIKNYIRVFNSNDSQGKKVFRVKKHIANGYPVIVGLQLRQNFRTQTGQYWQPDSGNTKYLGGHAMTIVAYSDYKEAFKLVNSWGRDWGQNGYIWIKYKDLAKYAPEAYRIILDEAKPEPDVPEVERQLVQYRGAFQFRTPVFNEDESISFNVMKPNRKGDFTYTFNKKWEIGDMFQLVVTETQENRAAYVFSIDAQGSNIHFPKAKGAINTAVYSAEETDLIPFKRVKIVVPGEDRALTKRIEGTDNIIVLYSYHTIKDFKARVAKVHAAKGSIESRLKAGFGDLIIPATEINYNPKGMRFTASTKSTKSVIPMILKIEE